MARLVTCGFEMGSKEQAPQWTGNPSASTTQKRSGAYSLRNTGSYYCRWPFAATDVFYLRLGVFPEVGETGGVLSLLDSTGTAQLSVSFGTLWLTLRAGSGSGASIASGSPTLRAGTWNCLEMYGKIDGVNGEAILKVNGVTSINFAGNTLTTANADVAFLTVPSSSLSASGYYDDIALNDDAGAVNNSWVGRGGIYPGVVNADGDSTDLTPSAGSNYECVDERPPNNDTDYVSSDVVDDHDLYTIAATGAPATGDVSAVVVWARARLSEAGAGNIATVIKPNAAETDSSDYGLDVSYEYFSTLYELNPETSAAWSVAEVDATQIGVKVR